MAMSRSRPVTLAATTALVVALGVLTSQLADASEAVREVQLNIKADGIRVEWIFPRRRVSTGPNIEHFLVERREHGVSPTGQDACEAERAGDWTLITKASRWDNYYLADTSGERNQQDNAGPFRTGRTYRHAVSVVYWENTFARFAYWNSSPVKREIVVPAQAGASNLKIEPVYGLDDDFVTWQAPWPTWTQTWTPVGRATGSTAIRTMTGPR